MTNIRVSQAVLEALLSGNPNLRVSQLPIEVLLDFYNTSNVRVSQMALEVLTLIGSNPNLRISQLAIEVLVGEAPTPPPPVEGRVLGPPVQII